jgi:hypothetical protein
MSTGWLGLAATVIGLLGGAPADDVVYINQQRFTIPIRVAPDRRGEVQKLVLYVSRDQGKTWGIHGQVLPDKPAFEFYAENDGLYYFAIAVIDRSGRQDPPDVYRAPPGQKIYIDTKKPVLGLEAQRNGDEVVLSYSIQEEHPERESLRLEYKAGDTPGGQWTPLPITGYSDRGNVSFRAGTPGPVTVRLSLRDLAQNESTKEKVVPGSGMVDPGVRMAGGNVESSQPPPPTPPAGGGEPAFVRANGGTPLASTQPQPQPQPPIDNPQSFGSGVSASPTRGSLPPLQIVNKRQVKLGFDVTRFGPSGLGGVDVYVTTDEGATWDKSQDTPGVTLPVTAETRAAQPVRGSVTVNLPKDGVIYGFYLVIKNRAGLGKEPPSPGASPHARIELDTIQPEAELYAPQADPVRHDCLALTWKATDRNLAPNPISIEWSAGRDGPWTFIGEAQLANTGRYLWQVPPNAPAKVYLKLSVRDTAGNTAIAQTPQPVIIDVTPPELGNNFTVMP